MEPGHESRFAIQPGDLLGEIYLVERVIGQGAMGQVCLARDTKLDRSVAIKVLRDDHATEPQRVQRFHREALAMSRVVHPNVVGIHAFGSHNSRFYIAMEFVDGEDLEAYMGHRGALELPEALSILRQVASGLSEAHALGIIHRDIKPSNILLRRLASGAMLAKVMDFGLAGTFGDAQISTSDVTHADAVIGTPDFMAPEQVQRHVLDDRTDAYALAALFSYMVTGRALFRGGSAIAVMLAHVSEPPPRLSELAPEHDWPEALEHALAVGLSKSPEDRYESLGALVTALADAADEKLPSPLRERSCGLCSKRAGSDDRFCSGCGGALPALSCPTCTEPNDGSTYVCSSCGAVLLSSSRWVGRAMDLPLGVVLVARAIGSSRPDDFPERFMAAVEREHGRAVSVVGNEGVALFGLGRFDGRETESAMDVALSLSRVHDCPLAIGVARGTLVRHGAVVARHGSVVIDGDAVERARAAAMSLGAQDGIVIGETAYQRVRGVFETTRQDALHRVVLGRKSVPFGLDSPVVRGLELPFVGRELELALLKQVIRRVIDTEVMHVVPIIGAPGSGKSRLVNEILRHLEDDDQQAWRLEAGWCRPASLDAYGPLSDMLRARLKMGNAPAVDLVRERISELPGIQGPDSARRVEALGRLIGVPPLGSGTDTFAPATAEEQRAAFEVFTEYIQAAARQRRMLMLVDDLHWASRPTLELLAAVIDKCQDEPVLMLLPIRADKADGILSQLNVSVSTVQTVMLEPLSADAIRRMASSLLGNVVVPEELDTLIRSFSDGIPFYVEQSVEILVESGLVAECADGEISIVADAPALALQHSREQLVKRRLERLSEVRRTVLEAIASCGHEAPLGLIAEMTGPSVTESDLSALVSDGLLVRRRRGRFANEADYGFRLPSFSEMVLSLVTPNRRTELLSRAVDWFRNYDGPKPPGFTALLGQHLLASADKPAAAHCMLEVAREATLAFANTHAFEAYGTATELATAWRASEPESAEAVRALLQASLGQAGLGLPLGLYEQGLESARVAYALASDDDMAAGARALCLEGDLLEAMGRDLEAVDAFFAASQRASGVPDGIGLAAYAGGRRAMALLKQNMTSEAERAARDVLEMAEAGSPVEDGVQTELHRGLGSAHGTLGHLMARRKSFDGARTHYATARLHRVAAKDVNGAAMASLALGNVNYLSGNLGAAEQAYRAALEACEDSGFLRGTAVARTNLGNVYLDLGRPEEALIELRKAELWLNPNGDPQELAETLRLIERAENELG